MSRLAKGSSSQRWWLLWFVVGTLVLIQIPYLLAYSQAGRGWVFAGMLWSPHDYAQYASAMRQGASSESWLAYDHLSHEAHEPAFIYPFYVALGKLSAAVSVDPSVIYGIAEIVGRAVLLLAVYAGTRLAFEDARERRLALILTAFSSGLGALLLSLGIAMGLPTSWPIFSAPETSIPELSTFLVLFTAPHLTLALAALILWSRAYLAACERGARSGLVGIACATAALGVLNPFSLITLLAVAGAYGLMSWVARREFPWGSAWALAVTASSAAPFIAYNVLVFSRDPFWGGTYSAQNVLPTPSPLILALAFGATLGLAVIGLPRFLAELSAGRRLVLVWIVVAVALMYMPVSFQRRLGFGVQPMLALLATVGLVALQVRLAGSGDRMRRFVLKWAVPTLLGTTSVTLYLWTLRAGSLPVEDVAISRAFQRASVHQAAHWLAHTADRADVILADEHTLNYLGGWVTGRVFVAHWVATADYVQKRRQAAWFFQEADSAGRREMVERLGVRYVVYGPRERSLGGVPLESDWLSPVFNAPELTVYRVEPTLGLAGTRPRS